MRNLLYWLSERLDSLSVRLELWAEILREKSRAEDLELPFYTEGPEDDQ